MSRVSSRMRAGSVILGSIMTILGSPTMARSEEPPPRQQFITAPYVEADAAGMCSDLSGVGTDDYTATCTSHTATADASTGTMSIDLRARSPMNGTLPGIASLNGWSHIGAVHKLGAPTAALLYVATLSLGTVTDASDGSLLRIPTGSIMIEVAVTHPGCTCRMTTSRVLLPEDSGKQIRILTVLTDPTGAPLPEGDVKIDITARASATLAGIGEVAASMDAVVDQVEAAAPSVTREVGAPYMTAGGARFCSGSLGTTFACRATAARTTGRTEIDLGVTSPVAGTAPGSGSANGGTQIAVDVRSSAPVRAAAYVMTFHVRDAEAFTSVTSPVIGSASAQIDSVASIRGLCAGCSGGATAPIIGSPESRLDDDVTYVLWAISDGAGVLPDSVSAVLDVQGWASLEKASGQARAMLSGALASVRIVELA